MGKSVIKICVVALENTKGVNKWTHPEGLLAKEVRVTAPCPQASRHESTLGIDLGPVQPRARPLIFVELHTTVLERLERILLVIRRELDQKRDYCEDA